MSDSSRAVAVAVLTAVEAGAFADVALRGELTEARLPGGTAARATALTFGAIRLRRRSDYLLRPLVSRPFGGLDPLLRSVLRVGVYELLWTRRVTPPAVVHDLVTIARTGGDHLAGFANAVLRRVADDAERLRQTPPELLFERDPEGHLIHWQSHPRWLVERWLARDPQAALQRCLAGNRDPTVTLRTNLLRTDRETLLERLAEEGIEASPSELSPLGIRLEAAGRVESLPGYNAGWFAIQDEAAMLITPVTGATPGQRVIDLCAAPGGKTTQLAEQMRGEGTILACDRNEARLLRVESSARRLGLGGIELRPGDARGIDREVEPADVVLLDAPCAGTGTLARRADLRWRLGPQRLEGLVALQRELLETAAALTRPGGVLVYATCSLEPEENEEQLAWLAERWPELQPDSDVGGLPPGWDADHAWVTIEPSATGHDGMFIARRRRVP